MFVFQRDNLSFRQNNFTKVVVVVVVIAVVVIVVKSIKGDLSRQPEGVKERASFAETC